MVGLVIVSHSAALAGGVVELAREMGGPEVAIEAAGGLDEPGGALGTDAELVSGAIRRADSGDGVLVLMDLGSAVLSAETALDLLGDDGSARVRLCSAPLVEGAVGAAAAARQGLALEEVAREAARGLRAKQEQLGDAPPEPDQPASEKAGGGQELRLVVSNPLGLHARPAARLVRTAASYDARISVTNATRGRGPASARSLSAVATLGVRQGDEIVVSAAGPAAGDALEALRALAEDGFGDAGVDGAAPDERPRRRPARSAGRLQGAGASPGWAVGPARRFAPPEPEVSERPSGPPETEWDALRAALARTRADLSAARGSAAAGEAADILDAVALLLDDDELLGPARRHIFAQGLGAGAAWAAAADDVARAYEELDDDYQRQRAADVRDLRRRVLVRLAGGGEEQLELEHDAVLVAEDLAPADVAVLDPSHVVGLATARGAATSHAAILARAAGIPAAVGVGESLLEVDDGTTLVVDGGSGTVFVAPPEDVVDDARARRAAGERAAHAARAAAEHPAVTRDGVRVEVMANAGSLADAERAVEMGADGIGLLRTEFLFGGRKPPSEQEQAEAYGAITHTLAGRPLVVRTLDAGGDKPLAFLTQGREANPFLGARGLRLSLHHPELLETQLRAALRVARAAPVRIMFPMVTTVGEMERARALLAGAEDGDASVEVGMMVEVPAAALAADRLARVVDFFSVGTNDLAQYTMAAERGNAQVAHLADALHPAVLRLLGYVCDAARRHAVPVAVCGELAADPVAVPVLLGLGVSHLSVHPNAVPGVKQAVRATMLASARGLADRCTGARDAAEVRAIASGESDPEARP